MSKRNKKKKGKWDLGLKKETKHSILAIISFVLALFFTLAAFGKAGVVGNSIYSFLNFLFGAGFFLLPFAFLLTGVSFLSSLRPDFMMTTLTGSIFFLFSSLGITDIIFKNSGTGGWIGKIVSFPLIKLFDFWTSLIFLFAILIISILVMFNLRIHFKWPEFLKWQRKTSDVSSDAKALADKEEPETSDIDNEEEEYEEDNEDEEKKKEDKEENPPAGGEEPAGRIKKAVNIIKEKIKTSKSEAIEIDTKPHIDKRVFTPPPLSLLEGDKGKPSVGDTKANSNIIKRTLGNFGIDVEMGEISIGPSVTQYTLKPAEGVKLSKIITLQNDLSLALAVHPIRIEAPIPGKSLIGIEIPNTVKVTVGLANLLSNDSFQNSGVPLLFSLGRGVSGKAFFSDLSKMPHLLIAGATGSGKSVMIHSLITSLLYRNSPSHIRFIMIDPKRVELTIYNGIPHLLTPTITDPKKAILTLKWAAREMERRYDILEQNAVRDIGSYHKNILGSSAKTSDVSSDAKALADKEKPEGRELEDAQASSRDVDKERMPHIVIIIDELADIMATYPRELESAIVRLAQMSRAVGIHLVLSTQRPSVEIITGLIKANIPARIAFQVASQIDSRTILDMAGAERLLGSGDMLYMSGDMSKPRRIQSPFISEREVKKVVKFLKGHYEDELPDKINLLVGEGKQNSIFSAQSEPASGWENDDEDSDELYEDARELVIKAGKASASYLQRRLRIGYARAARLLDELEERGVIGPGDGAKAREVYLKHSDPVVTADLKNEEEENE